MIEIAEKDRIKHKGKIFEIKTVEEMRVPNIRIGDFRNRVVIQAKAPVPDGEGGFTEAWVDVGRLWAKVLSLKAEQQYEFNSIGVEATHRVEVRGPQGKRILTCRELR